MYVINGVTEHTLCHRYLSQLSSPDIGLPGIFPGYIEEEKV